MSAACLPETERSATATATPPAKQEPKTSPCPKCGSTEPWGFASWCPTCGYYPALGTIVDEKAKPVAHEPEPEVLSYRDLLQKVPRWVWGCALGIVGILFANLALGLAFSEGTPVRQWCIVCELGLAGSFLFALHIAALLYAVPRSDKIGPFDLFSKPFALWRTTFQDLPLTWRRVTLGAWASAAMTGTSILNGGVSYDWIWKSDWGFERKAQANLVQAIVQQARQQKGGAESLEEAMNDFAGEEQDAEKESTATPEMTILTDCLVIGYTLTPEDTLGTLLLAAAPNGKLLFVGRVTADAIPQNVQSELMRRLRQIRQAQPFLKCNTSGQWVRPQVMCRITHTDWSNDDQLIKPEFAELLSDVQLGQ